MYANLDRAPHRSWPRLTDHSAVDRSLYLVWKSSLNKHNIPILPVLTWIMVLNRCFGDKPSDGHVSIFRQNKISNTAKYPLIFAVLSYFNSRFRKLCLSYCNRTYLQLLYFAILVRGEYFRDRTLLRDIDVLGKFSCTQIKVGLQCFINERKFL
jgi:hypothetical protein